MNKEGKPPTRPTEAPENESSEIDENFEADFETGFIDDTKQHFETDFDSANPDPGINTTAETNPLMATDFDAPLGSDAAPDSDVTDLDAAADAVTGPLTGAVGREPDIGSDLDTAADAEIGAQLDAALDSADRTNIDAVLDPNILAKLESSIDSTSNPDASVGTDPETEIDVDEERFWQALQSEDGVLTLHKNGTPTELDAEKTYSVFQKPVDLTEDLSDLSPKERDHRRQALRTMLDASEARQQRALRNKPPVLAIGVVIRVINGTFQDQEGTVLDADFINSRALIDLAEESESQWVEFMDIGSVHSL